MKYSREHLQELHRIAVEESGPLGELIARSPEPVKHLIYDLCDTASQLYEELEEKKKD